MFYHSPRGIRPNPLLIIGGDPLLTLFDALLELDSFDCESHAVVAVGQRNWRFADATVMLNIARLQEIVIT